MHTVILCIIGPKQIFDKKYFRIKIELHFSLIAAAVTYIMWKHVGKDKIQKVEKRKKLHRDDEFDSDGTLDPKKRRGYWRVDCQGASKGLFLGLLCLVGGIIILIIFFVMKVSSILVFHYTLQDMVALRHSA